MMMVATLCATCGTTTTATTTKIPHKNTATTATPTAPEFTGERPEKRVRMTRLRQTVARRLLEVQQ